jgi:hypothetical protein
MTKKIHIQSTKNLVRNEEHKLQRKNYSRKILGNMNRMKIKIKAQITQEE